MARLDFFGPSPLLEGEDAAAYDDLLARVSGAVKPTDIFEEFWVRDVVDLTLGIQRWRRLKATVITANAHQGVEAVLKPLIGFIDAQLVAERWAQRDPDAVKKVEKEFKSAGLSIYPIGRILAARTQPALPAVPTITGNKLRSLQFGKTNPTLGDH